ncbi:YjbF family lipoprotein [Paracoccaceae bacterium]|nr:YjbF family lipoprotein [Paracoccaceae bacterium]
MKKIIFFFLCLFCLSCSSDSIISSEKTNLYNIYKDLIFSRAATTSEKTEKQKKVYNREWLSKFNQPIILLSSLDGKLAATLVALGNNDNKLTWVSSDGISVSFSNGILIATRGYSHDLMESRHNDLNILFKSPSRTRSKTYRYLDGENEYNEFNFSCTVTAKPNTTSFFLDLELQTTKFIEKCESRNISHVNEYYVLPETNIVLKSKQWISEANGYIIIHNYYAFQNDLF